MRRIVVGILTVVLGAAALQAATFTIDPNHSDVSFRVKHVVGKVSGKFDKFAGTFNYEEGKPQTWSAQASIETASINTGIEKRDTHLKSPDFFDVQKFPTMTFKSTGVSGNKLTGNLTLHGVTKPVTLELAINGVAKDPMGPGQRAGATATGMIKRTDFNLGPTTGPLAGMVGTDVEITIDVEGVSK